MTRFFHLLFALASAFVLAGHAGEAQQPTGWGMEITGGVAYRGDADLSDGGDLSTTRAFLRVGGLYRFDARTAAGLSLGYGQRFYDFGGGANPLWGNVRAIRLSVPIRFQLGQSTDVFMAPQVRRVYETGAGGSDSQTYGIFAGVSWQINDKLRIGPAFGAFSKLEGSGVEAFPALILDWQIADRWTFSTGSGLAATRGPGLRLGYAYSDALDVGIGVRRERSEFRLDSTGLAPGGVGEDESLPVVLYLDYNPNPGLSVSGFFGAAFDGDLTVENSRGVRVGSQTYDTAPVAGLALRVRF